MPNEFRYVKVDLLDRHKPYLQTCTDSPDQAPGENKLAMPFLTSAPKLTGAAKPNDMTVFIFSHVSELC
jgi:hypothetical protein